MPKITIIGAGDIGKNTLAAILRIFPKDQDVEIILLNRTKEKAEAAILDAHFADDTNFGPNQDKNTNTRIKVRASSDPQDLAGSDVVIFTAGASAVVTGATDRESALSKVYDVVSDYGQKIKLYAPQSQILMITNPSDITTWLMQIATGFDSKQVVGFGCELDARRFTRALREELCQIGINPESITADVIGGHSKDNMIIPEMSLFIGRLSLQEFKAKHPDKYAQIDIAVKNADQIMRNEGFQIIRNGGKAYFAPVIPVAMAARAFLFENAVSMSCTQVLSQDRNYYGIDHSCISVPMIISKGDVMIMDRGRDRDYMLTSKDIAQLEKVALRHDETLAKFIIKNLAELKHSEASYAQLKIQIKESVPPEQKSIFLQHLSSYFKSVQPDLEFKVSADGKSLSTKNTKENLEMLKAVGLTHNQEQARL